MMTIKSVILSISIILFSGLQLLAQNETEKKTPDLTFVVKKLPDGSFELKSRLSLFEKKVDYPIAGSKIDYSIGSNSDIKIEGNTTDKNGYAIAIIKPGVKLPRDKGIIKMNAEFAGNDSYEAASAEVVFTETRINVTCEMVDTIKTAKVEAYKINGDGSESPLSGETVIVSVQRMFSRLPIGEANIDETGKGSVEFPNDLPGDSLGNLHIVAYISEHELYGNVDASTQIKWGIAKPKLMVTHRALWTQIAPMWMIVSLTILLIGVWAHYFYVIAQLVYIKIKGKKTIVE